MTQNSDASIGELTTFFSSADRVPPKALAVAQAEREGGLNVIKELNRQKHEQNRINQMDHAELKELVKEALTKEFPNLIREMKKTEEIILSRKEAAAFLKITLPTLHRFQETGIGC